MLTLETCTMRCFDMLTDYTIDFVIVGLILIFICLIFGRVIA